MKTETLDEYLKRGGKITILAPQESPTVEHTIPVSLDVDLGSLELGSVMMSPLRERKDSKIVRPRLKEILKKSWLPEEIKKKILSKMEPTP